MNTRLKKWRDDEGGLDFVQMVIGLLIISIAAVGTFQALFFGQEQLDYQMRYRKAISVARSYAEYWQGRIHTDFPEPGSPSFNGVKAGNLARPLEVLLDTRDPNNDADDIMCNVAYAPLVPIDKPTTGPGIDYWQIKVRVTWLEPSSNSKEPGKYEVLDIPHSVEFHAAMTSATL